MFPDPTIDWDGYPSPIDGIQYPNLRLLYAACGDRLGLVAEVSEWRNEICLEAYTVRFPKPICWLGADETIYSILNMPSDSAKRPDTYLRVTDRSKTKRLAQTFSDDLRNAWVLRQFLLVGLNTCMEVLANCDPEIRQHKSSEAAELWVQEELHAPA